MMSHALFALALAAAPQGTGNDCQYRFGNICITDAAVIDQAQSKYEGAIRLVLRDPGGGEGSVIVTIAPSCASLEPGAAMMVQASPGSSTNRAWRVDMAAQCSVIATARSGTGNLEAMSGLAGQAVRFCNDEACSSGSLLSERW